MSGPERGLRAAVNETMPEDDDAPIVQTSLFPAADLHALPETGVARNAAIRGSRGRGRPAGSKNKKTAKIVDYITSNYGHPLVMLAETFNRSVADLATELGCDKLEAFKLQLAAARELGPYIQGKQPVTVAVRTEMPTLMLADPSMLGMMAASGTEEAAELPDLSEMKVIENQCTSGGSQSKVCQKKSVTSPETAEIQGSAPSVPLISNQSAPTDEEA